jgi:hypothetical protein
MTSINYNNNNNNNNKIRFDYSAIGIYNKNKNIKLENTIKVLESYSLKNQIENDHRIRVTALLVNDIKETKTLISANLVDKTLFRKHSSTKIFKTKLKPIKAMEKSNMASHLNENKISLLERRKLVSSAPIDRKKNSSAESKINGTDNETIQKIVDSDGEEIDENGNLVDKTILRKLQPNTKMSLSVDKWVEIHQRRAKSANNNSRDSKKVQILETQKKVDTKIKINNENNLPTGITSRSRRELSELTVLDKVRQKQRKIQLEEFQELQRMKRKEEFNKIVSKIRDYLNRMEKFKNKNLVYGEVLPQRQHFVKLYEYV